MAGLLAVGNWIAAAGQQKPLEYVCKPGTLAALLGVALALDPTHGDTRAWFVVALVLSLAGDVFLMVPSDRFIAGLTAFLLAHVAYVIGLTRHGGSAGALLIAAIPMVVVAGALGARFLRAAGRAGQRELFGPLVAYMAVIAAMVTCALASGIVLAGAGAVLFMASDALIAETRFVAPAATAALPTVAAGAGACDGDKEGLWWAPLVIIAPYRLVALASSSTRSSAARGRLASFVQRGRAIAALCNADERSRKRGLRSAPSAQYWCYLRVLPKPPFYAGRARGRERREAPQDRVLPPVRVHAGFCAASKGDLVDLRQRASAAASGADARPYLMLVIVITSCAWKADAAYSRRPSFRRRFGMVLAADWTFGDFVLGVLVVFAWVVLFWFVITVFVDIFRRDDINGWVKAFWVIFVVVLPWLGVLIYLITQHEGMAQRSTREAARERDELRQAVGFSVADELVKLDHMKNEGRLSDDEYQRLRSRLVG